jgi:hypothetical protein
MPNDKTITIRGMFGYHTQEPLVLLRLGEEMAQVEPAEAEKYAIWLLEAAAAARADGAIVRTIQALTGDERLAGGVLNELRQIRENTNSQKGARADLFRRLRAVERQAAERALAQSARAWLAHSEAASVAGAFAAELVARFRAGYDRN